MEPQKSSHETKWTTQLFHKHVFQRVKINTYFFVLLAIFTCTHTTLDDFNVKKVMYKMASGIYLVVIL